MEEELRLDNEATYMKHRTNAAPFSLQATLEVRSPQEKA